MDTVNIPIDSVKALREQSGAGIMDCRKALIKTAGDLDQALNLLKEQSLVQAQKKVERSATEGTVEAYIHGGGRIGAMVELNCESDFVARTAEFKELAHNLAMQVAALCPEFITAGDLPEDAEAEPEEVCLLLQPYIKDTTRTVQDVITETIARLGENIKVSRIARFELGQ